MSFSKLFLNFVINYFKIVSKLYYYEIIYVFILFFAYGRIFFVLYMNVNYYGITIKIYKIT